MTSERPHFHDEGTVVALIKKRLVHGFKEYGALKVANDNRDYLQESLEEALDMSVYLACKLIQLRRHEQTETEALEEEHKTRLHNQDLDFFARAVFSSKKDT